MHPLLSNCFPIRKMSAKQWRWLTGVCAIFLFLVSCGPTEQELADQRVREEEKHRLITETVKQQKINELLNQLKLAERKSDLDQMYLALMALADQGEHSAELQAKTERVERALDLLKLAARYEAEEKYEDVVAVLNPLLEFFPGHIQANAIKARTEAFFDKRRKQVEYHQHELETARKNTDIEGMRDHLLPLDELGELTLEQQSELEKARTAVDLLESLRSAEKRHEHEKVVKFADELLTLYPNHRESAEELRNSGQLLLSLNEALVLFRECFNKGDDPGQVLLMRYDEHSGENIADLRRIAYNFESADRLIENALVRDENYKVSRDFEELLSEAKTSLGMLLVQSVIDNAKGEMSDARDLCGEIADLLPDLEMDEKDGAEFWQDYEAVLRRRREEYDFNLERLEEIAATLKSIKTEDTEKIFDEAVLNALSVSKVVDAVFEPKFTSFEYIKAVHAVLVPAASRLQKFSDEVGEAATLEVLAKVMAFYQRSLQIEVFTDPLTRQLLAGHKVVLESR